MELIDISLNFSMVLGLHQNAIETFKDCSMDENVENDILAKIKLLADKWIDKYVSLASVQIPLVDDKVLEEAVQHTGYLLDEDFKMSFIYWKGMFRKMLAMNNQMREFALNGNRKLLAKYVTLVNAYEQMKNAKA